MASKFYVVWQGRVPGIYTDWDTCKKQVEKFPDAKYKSFATRAEAEKAFGDAKAAPRAPFAKSASGGASKVSGPKTYTAQEVAALPQQTKIFCDGGCDPNPGKAGSGLALYRDGVPAELWYGKYDANGTNNTAELNALHQALLLAQQEVANGRSVAVFCDSKYSIQCVTEWAIGWEKKGWKKAGGEIKNLDLIKTLFALHQSLKEKVDVLHVNGHVGVEGNELADRMSILAITRRNYGFSRYEGQMNLAEILAMRAG
ncbi:MAG: viroplasmin family protein [Burkholderiales bacterium]|nr:viroplasmin family protein [Burkholderiales bacterium]